MCGLVEPQLIRPSLLVIEYRYAVFPNKKSSGHDAGLDCFCSIMGATASSGL